MASLDDELARHLRRRRRRPGKWVLLAVAALVAAYVAAVGVHTLTTDDLAREDTCVASYAEDGGAAGQLRDALRRVEASGTGAPLAELAPGDWDAVYAFSAGLVVAQPGDAGHGVVDVDAAVGCAAMLPYRASFPTGSVLFFMREGEVVQALEVGYFVADEQAPWTWSREVRVEPGKPDPACVVRCLRLVEPGAGG
ncbi:hypothetical protein [Streptodolium elevatio]|uniref:Uncharacterized protein n=1 Tax=Streptodolium elevatio TaxID=3157996 RepID=A0ABV3DQY7_9ACTN